jgi:hypothetical protein
MSEIGDDFKALADHRKILRAKYGVSCPRCRQQRPRGNASLLLPQQRCKIDGYVDERPELTESQLTGETPC